MFLHKLQNEVLPNALVQQKKMERRDRRDKQGRGAAGGSVPQEFVGAQRWSSRSRKPINYREMDAGDDGDAQPADEEDFPAEYQQQTAKRTRRNTTLSPVSFEATGGSASSDSAGQTQPAAAAAASSSPHSASAASTAPAPSDDSFSYNPLGSDNGAAASAMASAMGMGIMMMAQQQHQQQQQQLERQQQQQQQQMEAAAVAAATVVEQTSMLSSTVERAPTPVFALAPLAPTNFTSESAPSVSVAAVAAVVQPQPQAPAAGVGTNDVNSFNTNEMAAATEVGTPAIDAQTIVANTTAVDVPMQPEVSNAPVVQAQ